MKNILLQALLLCTISVQNVAVGMDEFSCQSYNETVLYYEAIGVFTKLASKLALNYDYIDALNVVSVNSSSGEDNGGGTNPFGVYNDFYVNNSEFQNDGSDFCSTIAYSSLPNCNEDYGLNFIMGPSDAVVFYQCSPPEVQYYGFDVIINSRFSKYNKSELFYPGQVRIYVICIICFHQGLIDTNNHKIVFWRRYQ